MNDEPTADTLSYVLLTVGAANFAMSFLLTKVGLTGFQPLSFVALRLAIASVVLWAAMVALRAHLPPLADTRAWWLVLGTGLFGNALPFSLITWGQAEVPAGTTAILVAVMPLTTVVLAHLIGDERMTGGAVAGCILGLIGVGVLMGWDAVRGLAADAAHLWAIVGAALAFAVNAVLMRQMRGHSMPAMSFAMVLTAFAMTVPAALLVEGWAGIAPFRGEMAGPIASEGGVAPSLVALVVAGIFPTAIGTLIIINITKRAGAPFLGQINFLVPIFGVMFAALFLGEAIEPRAGVALVLILAGIAITRLGRTPRTIARSRA